MASLLKNQILKYLSRFTKNLSPDKISLSALKGEGELANLELDETVLMDILDLPTWLRLSKAMCNKVGIKFLDEIVLEVETCDDPRPPNNPSNVPSSSYRPGGKYGFVDRAIDSIYVHINSVIVKFVSKTFQASLQLSRVKVHSVTPTWQATSDLRLTRIKDVSRGEILMFKEVDWQATRIEAQAVKATQTPIRFIANQAKLRISIKKKLSDSSIVSSRVVLLLDDLLWVLTETQLKAALLYGKSLQEVIEKSTRQSKQLAAEKLQKQGHIGAQADQIRMQQRLHQQQQHHIQQNKQPTSKASIVFSKFDVQSTSYHLITSRIDLHLCDDSLPQPGVSPKHNHQIEGGAMQITLNRLALDYYPFNPAGGERKLWYRYSDNIGSRNHWVHQLFGAFKLEVMKAREACGIVSPAQSPSHIATAIQSVGSSKIGGQKQCQQQGPAHSQSLDRSASSGPVVMKSRSTRLLESCIVLEIEEFTIFCISTADNKRNSPNKFFSSEKKVLHLPVEMPIIHMEYTDYYFPEGIDYPVPHANLYILVNPVQIRLDYLTLLWANYFFLHLAQNLKVDGAEEQREHVDMKLEALMPKIVIPGDASTLSERSERPDVLQIQISKIAATNCRIEDSVSRERLLKVLDMHAKADLFHRTSFPVDDNNWVIIPPQLKEHATGKDNPYIDQLIKQILEEHTRSKSVASGDTVCQVVLDSKVHLKLNSLKLDAKYDVWNVNIDQIWMEFAGVSSKSRPVSFMEAFPLSFWFCRPQTKLETEHTCDQQRTSPSVSRTTTTSPPSHLTLRPSNHVTRSLSNCDTPQPVCCKACDTYRAGSKHYMDMYLLAAIEPNVKIQLNHFQYLFLLRLSESFSDFQKQLNADTEVLSPDAATTSVCVCSVIQEVELALTFSLHPATTTNLALERRNSFKGMLDLHLLDKEFSSTAWQEGSQDLLFSEGSVVLLSKSYSDSRLNISKTSDKNFHIVSDYNEAESVKLSQSDSSKQAPACDLDNRPPTEAIVHKSAVTVDHSSMASETKQTKKSKLDKKKGLSNAWSTFTGRLRSLSDLNDEFTSNTDDAETISLHTDMSSDDESFEHLSLEDVEEVHAFDRKQDAVDTASSTGTGSEIQEDLSTETPSTAREKQQVGVVAFRLSGVEFIGQGLSKGVIARSQVNSISVHENKCVILDEFHRMFTSSHGLLYDPHEISCRHFPLKTKFMVGILTQMTDPVAQEQGYLHVDVDKSHFKFSMSTLSNIADFLEDEIPPIFMPLFLNLVDLKLTMEEDRLPRNKTTCDPIPVELHLHNATVDRGADGVFHLKAGGTQSRLTRDHKNDYSVDAENSRAILKIQKLQRENQALKKSLSEVTQLKCEHERNVNLLLKDIEVLKHRAGNDALVRCLESNNQDVVLEKLKTLEMENMKMQQKVVDLEDEVHTSNKEKDSLLATMQLLQEELMASEQQRARFNSYSAN